MKISLLIVFFCTATALGFAKNPEERTFLVIFDKTELKENKTSAAYIELSLMNIFKTKSYSGNSDAAILIKVPHNNFDKCQLGDYIVRVNQKKITTLEDIAFQIIDLDESKDVYRSLVASYEDKNQKTKKPVKNLKTASAH